MTKHELVGLTLDQLIETFRSSPESFTYEDKEYTPTKMISLPTIMWQPQIQLKDEQVVADPNNEPKTVIVVMNDMAGDISCYIFSKSSLTLANMQGLAADAIISSRQSFFTWRSNYRKFMKLKQLIVARDLNKENERFLKKLCSVFPTTLDKHFLE